MYPNLQPSVRPAPTIPQRINLPSFCAAHLTTAKQKGHKENSLCPFVPSVSLCLLVVATRPFDEEPYTHPRRTFGIVGQFGGVVFAPRRPRDVEVRPVVIANEAAQEERGGDRAT